MKYTTKRSKNTRRKTHETFLKEVELIGNGEYEVLDKYEGGSVKLRYEHKKCGRIFTQTPGNFLQNFMCAKCSPKMKAMRLSDEEFLSKLSDVHGDEYTPLEKYFRSNTKINTRHEKCGREWLATPGHLLSGKGCPSCGIKKNTKARTMTHEEFLKRVAELRKEEYDVLGKYVNNHTHIKVRHNNCGNIYDVVPASFLIGRGCPICGQLSSIKNRTLTHEVFEKRVRDVMGNDYKLLSRYVNNSTRLEVKHKKCGHEYKVHPSNISQGHGCPKCNESKGEKEIADILEKNTVNYKREYKMSECKNIYPLPFDFAIFEKGNLSFLIEYEGRQHFEAVDFWGGEKGLKKQKMRDKIKRDYCKDNNIKLIEIPYWDFDNIETILNKELKVTSFEFEQMDIFELI